MEPTSSSTLPATPHMGDQERCNCTSTDPPPGTNYVLASLQVVYYVAPAVLVAAILFCCFRMGLVYYMQIRPRRNQQTASVQTSARSSELQAAAATANGFPAACREIFLRVPPPNYDETIKNDRRSRSTNDIEQTTPNIRFIEEGRQQRGNLATLEVPTLEVSQEINEPAPTTANDESTTTARRTTTIRRVQSSIETTPTPPDASAGPPAYSRTRRASAETIESERLSPFVVRDVRLPSYEEAVSATPSRRPTMAINVE